MSQYKYYSILHVLCFYVVFLTVPIHTAVEVTLNPTAVSLIEGEAATVCARISSPACEDIVFQVTVRGTGSNPADG